MDLNTRAQVVTVDDTPGKTPLEPQPLSDWRGAITNGDAPSDQGEWDFSCVTETASHDST